MDWQKYELHLFDLDDTLVTTRSAYSIAQEAAIRDAYPAISPQNLQELLPKLKWICHSFGSGNVREYMSAFLKSEPDHFQFTPAKLTEILHQYRNHFQSNLVCFDGVKLYLDRLVANQKKIGLISNGTTKSQRAKLDLSGLSPFFPKRFTFISDKFPQDLKKPSPFMVEKACKKVGVKPEKAVFYGNSAADMLAGNLAGVTTVHFAGSTALAETLPEVVRPDHTLLAWTDLLTFRSS
jgi:putative hydrolase of the HAD superfamily